MNPSKSSTPPPQTGQTTLPSNTNTIVDNPDAVVPTAIPEERSHDYMSRLKQMVSFGTHVPHPTPSSTSITATTTTTIITTTTPIVISTPTTTAITTNTTSTLKSIIDYKIITNTVQIATSSIQYVANIATNNAELMIGKKEVSLHVVAV